MPIDVNYYDKVVYITSPTTSVTVQELVDAMRAAEDTVEGMQFGDPVKAVENGFVDAEGKATLGGGFSTVITMTLDSDWYIEFWDGVNLGQVADGNVVGGKDDRPIRAAVGSADTVLVLGAERGVITSGGVSQSDIDAMADAVWDEDRADHTTAGTFGATSEWSGGGSAAGLEATGGGETVAAGSSASSILTTLAAPSDYFNGMYLVVEDTVYNVTVVRRIAKYNNTDGECIPETAFPFTPSEGASIYILNMRDTQFGRVI